MFHYIAVFGVGFVELYAPDFASYCVCTIDDAIDFALENDDIEDIDC